MITTTNRYASTEWVCRSAKKTSASAGAMRGQPEQAEHLDGSTLRRHHRPADERLRQQQGVHRQLGADDEGVLEPADRVRQGWSAMGEPVGRADHDDHQDDDAQRHVHTDQRRIGVQRVHHHEPDEQRREHQQCGQPVQEAGPQRIADGHDTSPTCTADADLGSPVRAR